MSEQVVNTVAPELTAEQKAQQAQMQATMQQQQQQIEAHINQQIQVGVQHYNLDVQRLTIITQGLESLSNIDLNKNDNGRTFKLYNELMNRFEQILNVSRETQQKPA